MSFAAVNAFEGQLLLARDVAAGTKIADLDPERTAFALPNDIQADLFMAAAERLSQRFALGCYVHTGDARTFVFGVDVEDARKRAKILTERAKEEERLGLSD